MANGIKRNTTAITTVKRGTSQVDKVYRGSTVVWENSILITTNTHAVSWGPGITIGLDLYSGTTPSVKNPTVYFSMGGSNGGGETSDRREYWCYAKRASDNVWVQIMYSAHENDVTAGSDSHTQNIVLSDGVYYNQFRYRMSGGFGQNTYWCASYVDQYWT